MAKIPSELSFKVRSPLPPKALRGTPSQNPITPQTDLRRLYSQRMIIIHDVDVMTSYSLECQQVGDKMQLLRRIDHNWFEAKIGTRRGLVPENYITVMAEPTEVRVTK